MFLSLAGGVRLVHQDSFSTSRSIPSLVCVDQAVISPKILPGLLSNNRMDLDITWTVGESQLLHSRGFSLPSIFWVKKRQVGDLPSTSRLAIGRVSYLKFLPPKRNNRCNKPTTTLRTNNHGFRRLLVLWMNLSLTIHEHFQVLPHTLSSEVRPSAAEQPYATMVLRWCGKHQWGY